MTYLCCGCGGLVALNFAPLRKVSLRRNELRALSYRK
jgi:hypothetical protein